MQDAAAIFLSVWFLHPDADNQKLPQSLRQVLPGVHRVTDQGSNWDVQSAGISLDSFGALEANVYEPPVGVRNFHFRIPKQAMRAEAQVHAPLGAIGVFVNGKPIYNPISTESYNGLGIWHRDAVRDSGAAGNLLTVSMAALGKHSPIIGYALDGYPIYGPYAPQALRSSYRLRAIVDRTILPDGTKLTPNQYGPAVSAHAPLGSFVEDYEYRDGIGTLDAHNGRFAATPEFPGGTYAYYLSTTEQGAIAYPYLIGPSYFGTPILSDAKQLRFAIRGKDGNNQRFPEIVHEKPMHLILVSDDMKDFMHLHPELGAGDEFEITPAFPRATRWHAFAQSTAVGGLGRVERRVIDVKETGPVQALVVPTLVVTIDAPKLETGKDLRLRFSLRDVKSGMPVTDLEPYLGAWGHFILISEDKKAFIHAHPLGDSAGLTHDHTAPLGPSPAIIEVVTGFDRPGRYRLWAQFQRQGSVMSIPFVLKVAAGAISIPAAVPEKLPIDAILVTVTNRGYEPPEVVARPGELLSLAFRREGNTNCGSKLVFSDLGISRELPAGATVVIQLPSLRGGTYRFTCGMGMFKGAIVIRPQTGVL